MANSIHIKLAFEDTDETRNIVFENLPDAALNPAPLKVKILEINASLAAGTSGGLNEFFLSNDGDNFVSIASAYSVSELETPITIPAEVS